MPPVNRVTLDLMISVLLRYQELALKGKNRPWFQRHLIRHLHRALAGLSVQQIRVPMGRIEVVLGRESTAAEVRERLRNVFGLANFSVATRVEPDVDAILAGILRDLPPGTLPASACGSAAPTSSSRCARRRSSGPSAPGWRRSVAGP